MNEYEMACEVRKRIEQFGKIIDGVYIFNVGGKFGTVKNYQQDEEHWEVMFDNLTHEQVIELFEGAGTCKQEEHGWSTEGDHARVWLTCGHDCMVETVADLPNFCPYCGRKVVDE